MPPLHELSFNSSVVSEHDETVESIIDITDNDITVEDDEEDLEVLEVINGVKTRSGRQLQRSFAASSVKCQNCRQSNPKCFTPADGVGNSEVVRSPIVNIVLDDDDDEENAEPLQYKITNFSIYCKADGEENHLVPVFADNLLITGKKIYLSGKVLRLDCQEDDEGLQVKDIGPITMWSNATGMDHDQENIIISSEHAKKELEFNLIRPSQEYLNIFKDVYRMAFLGNRIITKLLDCAEDGMLMEYEELLGFVRNLESPSFFGEKLPPCDDEFFQLHSNFIIEQVKSFDNEEVTISTLPCVRHMCRLSCGRGIHKPRGGSKNTPQPTTIYTKAQTTPLISELFDSIFQQQMKTNRAAKSKLCTCRNCQKNNCGNCERCEEMVSFGGKIPDGQVLCLERQCLKNLDQEVFLDDDDDTVTIKDRTQAVVEWRREPIKNQDGKVFYDEVSLKIGNRKSRVEPGSYLFITPDEEEHQSVPHYPCRVLYLYSRVFQGRQLDMAHVQWFARGENTVLGRTGDTREWFLVEECEDVILSTVSRVLDIEHLPVEDVAKWRKLGGTRGAIMKDDAGGKDGWWRLKYIPEFGRFELPSEEEIKLRGPGKCYQCDKLDKSLDDENAVVGKNGRSIRINGCWYDVGQFMMITDNTIRYKIPAKVPRTYSKPKVDPNVYPENWRKPDVYEGDHNDTWDPFQVVRLEEVVSRGREVYIRVRKLYRPHDTHLAHEEARTRPLTLLYWTEEIARMHPKEVAARTNKVSMEDVVGECFVRPLTEDTDVDSLVKWTDEGEDRFFVSESYTADTRRFSPLPQGGEVVRELEGQLSRRPAPQLAAVPPLNTLDIFAGCGGLSTGLGQAGVARHKWAIEFWKPSADAYKKNNPQCKVFNEECNGLLKKAMDGAYEENIPRKGDVDLLVGGPPCQGFSLLNNHKEGSHSKFKNSLIATYLSYCDFYRPKYFILENVRNIVASENGMVLKLILASLVKMGYQVGFQVLQAGHYGVAQTRRRLIILAAAPGLALPLYPEPLHTFAGPHYLEVDVDGRKYSPTCKRPGAPRRALTVWDAISDLPPIRSGHDAPVARFQEPPRTHLQQLFRAGTGATVEDHICKSVNSLCQMRINCVPKAPGSDWRDIPNMSKLCEDGKMAKKLHYPYNKADGTRGVCSCNVATGKRGNYCDQDDRQSDTLIPWSAAHTADTHNNWKEVYGRAPWDGYFKTTITDPEPMGKQGQVLHPEQDRILSVRELARSQGFPDHYKFAGTIGDRHREIGNAVPPPLGKALGLEIRKAILISNPSI